MIFHNHIKNFTTVHYQFRSPSKFQNTSKKHCVVSTTVLWNDINLLSEWPTEPKIIDKCAYGVLPERVDTLSTLFTIDISILYGFIFTTFAEHIWGLEYAQKSHHAFQGLVCTPYQRRSNTSLIACQVSMKPRVTVYSQENASSFCMMYYCFYFVQVAFDFVYMYVTVYVCLYIYIYICM